MAELVRTNDPGQNAKDHVSHVEYGGGQLTLPTAAPPTDPVLTPRKSPWDY
jgi:hypothetical protein